MNDRLLKSLMRFFALIENIHSELDHAYTHSFVELFLKDEYSDEVCAAYIESYENYYYVYHSINPKLGNRSERLTNELNNVSQSISLEMPPRNRFFLIIAILKLIKFFKSHDYNYPLSNEMSQTIRQIADQFKVPQENYLNIEAFILDSLHRIPNKKALLVVSDVTIILPDVKVVHRDHLDGQLCFLYDESINAYLFFYKGSSPLELNEKPIISKQLYIFTPSSSISGHTIQTIYYNDIVRRYLYSRAHTRITFTAEKISYCYRNSVNGIHPISFTVFSGQLVAVIGGSGVGKSTLMNLLNGMLTPQEGSVLINGYDLYHEKDQLKDIIGYVPQDDMLIESLSVYENLYYNARLYLSGLSENQIKEKVHHVLTDLDLYEIRDLKVGSALDRVISGGERKRLNIALELIREPSIIFLDEPTSGLSSIDAENIMHILQDLTLQGRLIIMNIHQPSSSVFRLFDQLIFIDKGGYPIFVGNTIDALRYFKRQANYIDHEVFECKTCHNTNPEVLFQIIEEKEINELGQQKGKRKRMPTKWYELFLKEVKSASVMTGKESLPEKKVKAHDRWKQFIIQSQRNFRSKLDDKPYMMLMHLVTPVLALILAFFCRYMADNSSGNLTYVFSKNENIPAFILMSVIVAMFVGMIMSAEELFHDRGLRRREKFHGLSSFSYLNAKIWFLFLVSASQAMSFVLVGNFILEIKGMTIMFWIILFSLYFFSNLLGLLISSGFKSIVAIYILVPMILVPEILFSGVIVKYDKLHPSALSARHVPLIGEVMASRWAYEAMMVEQFTENAYQKRFFDAEKRESNTNYLYYYFIPEMQYNLSKWKNAAGNEEEQKRELIYNGLVYYKQITGYSFMPELSLDKIDKSRFKSIQSFLNVQSAAMKNGKNKQIVIKDSLYQKVLSEFETEKEFDDFRDSYYNERVAEFVLNKTELRRVKIEKNHIVPLYELIYQDPLGSWGRAHYYASVKRVGSFYFDTPWYNVAVLWLMSFVLYAMLICNVVEKLILRIPRLFKRRTKFAQ